MTKNHGSKIQNPDLYRVTAVDLLWFPKVTTGCKQVWYPGELAAAKTSTPAFTPEFPT